MISIIKSLALILPLLMSSCEATINHSNSAGSRQSASSGLEKEYWYSGKAELTRYDLKQNRYNAIHNGEVVKIFVTEDFLTDKQVKNDNYTNPNSVSVLKMNDIRRFATGLYDYSIMTSVFTRADGSATEKITLSSQDWCGQTFVQLNRRGNTYDIQLRSYFESEGDENLTIKADLLEDEIMNLIRIDPELIPEGEVSILPSFTNLRFTHGEHKAQAAVITKSDYTGTGSPDSQLAQIIIAYPSAKRTLTIVYDPFDHNKIAGWTDSWHSGFDDKPRTTKATKTHESYEAYWQMNQVSDTVSRIDFGLVQYLRGG